MSAGHILHLDLLVEDIVLKTPKFMDCPDTIIILLQKGLVSIEEFDLQATLLVGKDISFSSPVLEVLQAMIVDLKLCSIYNFPKIAFSLKTF